jgi:type II secretory pathway predicted ATPase ExeA
MSPQIFLMPVSLDGLLFGGNAMNLSPDGPTSRVFRALVSWPHFERITHLIEQCHQISRLADEPQGMALEGVPGAGKTTLLKQYLAQHRYREEEYRTVIPVMHIETPSPVTIKSMAIAMLSAMHDPFVGRRITAGEANLRLIHLLRECQAELIMLDDFHHLIDPDSDTILFSVSEWLKVLMKETGMSVVAVSMPDYLSRIFAGNRQLSRLFPIRAVLPPLQPGPEIDHCLAILEQEAQFLCSTELPREDLVQRVYYATDGVMSYVVNWFRMAIRFAEGGAHSCLPVAVMNTSFRQYLSGIQYQKQNPFDLTRFPIPFQAPL